MISLHIIQAGRTPLPEGQRKEVEAFIVQPASPWFSREERAAISRALSGEFATTSHDYFFGYSAEGRFVSSSWYAVSRLAPEIAVLGYVFTDPEWRGRGLSTSLLHVLWKHFVDRGGKAMYLGTENPIARGVYLKNGFKDYNGQVMRLLTEDQGAQEFDDRHFEAGKRFRVRTAEWGDLAPATCLYTNPFPWVVRDFTEKIIVRPGDELRRCVSIFTALMLRSELPGNSMQIVETTDGHLVGCASIVSLLDCKELLLEFLVHPNYSQEAKALLQASIRKGKGLLCHAAGEDVTKLEILKSLGFRFSQKDGPAPGITTLERAADRSKPAVDTKNSIEPREGPGCGI
jgi:GNAT superfamily N-acetyltransferase